MDRTSSQEEEKERYLSSNILFLLTFFGAVYLLRLSKFVTTSQVLGGSRHKLWLVL